MQTVQDNRISLVIVFPVCTGAGASRRVDACLKMRQQYFMAVTPRSTRREQSRAEISDIVMHCLVCFVSHPAYRSLFSVPRLEERARILCLFSYFSVKLVSKRYFVAETNASIDMHFRIAACIVLFCTVAMVDRVLAHPTTRKRLEKPPNSSQLPYS